MPILDYEKAEAEAWERVEILVRFLTAERPRCSDSPAVTEALATLIRAAKAAEHVKLCELRDMNATGDSGNPLPYWACPRCGHGWECNRLKELKSEVQ